MFLRYSPLALAALLFSSCGNDLQIVSKERALSGSSHMSASQYQTVDPSSGLVAKGQGMAKDKHGMPFYSNERVRYVRTTAYTHTESDHIEYGAMNAAGTPLRYGRNVISAAADWSVYPVGTVFRIKGLSPLFVVDDYGSALTGTATIDIYTPSKSHMAAWGRRNVEISIVRWGSYQQSAELLSKRTHHSHCHQMYVNIQRKLGGGALTAMR